MPRISLLVSLLLLTAAACAPTGPVEGPYGIQGFKTQSAFFWVVPFPEGVVLVDSGDDVEGTLLKEAVDGRKVLAVLLTHGHSDHVAGARSLGDVLVLAGREDVPLIRGERRREGTVGDVRQLIPGGALEPAPDRLTPVDDGAVFHAGGDVFTAVALPGHTRGSVAWLYRDVLFGGDAAAGGETVGTSPAPFAENPKQAETSLDILHRVPFKTLLDGHNGRTDAADTKVPERTTY